MTMALCLNCGEIKCGALCDCPACQSPSSGNDDLDIAFSDWGMEIETMEECGKVIRQIAQNCEDPALRHWAFMQYCVSKRRPSGLKIKLGSELMAKVDEVLSRCRFLDSAASDAPSNGLTQQGSS